MPISIDGTGTITGLSAGGLPDDCITTAEIAGSAVTTAKINDANITYGKLSTSVTEADNVAKRTAKAWVNFDGTTNVAGNCTIRGDFNVSTVADNGTGDYTINFSAPMSDANYAFATHGFDPTLDAFVNSWGIGPSFTQSTSSIRLRCTNDSSAVGFVSDISTACVTIFGS
jgi:hypothetical protein